MPAQGSGGQRYQPGTLALDGLGYHRVVKLGVYPDRIFDPSYGDYVDGQSPADAEIKHEDKKIDNFWFRYEDPMDPEKKTRTTQGNQAGK